jgi:hypothetical protein
MFVLGVALVVLGYTTVYYGGSMAKAFNATHAQNLDPNSKGGIPFGVLLGVGKLPTNYSPAPEQQSFPPLPTGTENHRPKGFGQ